MVKEKKKERQQRGLAFLEWQQHASRERSISCYFTRKFHGIIGELGMQVFFFQSWRRPKNHQIELPRILMR